MIDVLIYETFALVVSSMNTCTTGGCDRFNTFHVGLLSDIQADNANAESYASYEFNRYKTETKNEGYKLPILILDPSGEVIKENGGSFNNYQTTKSITLYAGDAYKFGCCGVGNECTERSKMQIIQDLKNMLLAVVQNVVEQLEVQNIYVDISKITLSEDIGFSFGNIKIGGIKAEFEITYEDCYETCGFTFPEIPEEIICDDGGADILIGCSQGCDIYELYEYDITDNSGQGVIHSITINGTIYNTPDSGGIFTGNDMELQAFLMSIVEPVTLGYILTDNYFKLVAIGDCCTTENVISVNFEANLPPADYELVYQASYTLAELTADVIPLFTPNDDFDNSWLDDINACTKITLTATGTGTPVDVDMDTIEVSLDGIAWSVSNECVVDAGGECYFKRTITYTSDCVTTVIIKHIFDVVDCETLTIE